MSQSNIVLIEEPIENRIQNIFEEYIQKGLENKTDVILSNELKEKLAKISKRLGGANYKKVDTLIQSAFENQDYSIHFEWIELLLSSYYDKMYDYQLERKKDRCINSVFNGITITIDMIEDNPNKIRLFALRSFGESLYHSITDACLEDGYKSV